jgi:hypothetical protein
MNMLSTILVAAVFALSGASALAADPPKADAGAMKAAPTTGAATLVKKEKKGCC